MLLHMNPNPYAAPAASIDVPDTPLGPRPRRVTVAVVLLWISFVVSLGLAYVLGVREIDTDFFPVLLVMQFVGCSISVLVNVMIYRGHAWARNLFAWVFVLSSILLYWPAEAQAEMNAGEILAEQLLEAAMLGLEATALILLYTGMARYWFRREEA